MKPALFIAAAAIVVCGCTSRAVLLKPEGEAAELQMRDRTEPVRVELLAVSDSALILESGGRLSVADFKSVRQIQVPAYRTPVASKAVALIIILASHCYLWSVMGDSDELARTGLAIWTVGASYLMFTGDPQTRFSPPLDPKETARLEHFCRYPRGLTREQQQTLLERYGQTDFEVLGQ